MGFTDKVVCQPELDFETKKYLSPLDRLEVCHNIRRALHMEPVSVHKVYPKNMATIRAFPMAARIGTAVSFDLDIYFRALYRHLIGREAELPMESEVIMVNVGANQLALWFTGYSVWVCNPTLVLDLQETRR